MRTRAILRLRVKMEKAFGGVKWRDEENNIGYMEWPINLMLKE